MEKSLFILHVICLVQDLPHLCIELHDVGLQDINVCLLGQLRIVLISLSKRNLQPDFCGLGDLGRRDTDGMKPILDGGKFNMPPFLVELHLLDHLGGGGRGTTWGAGTKVGDQVEFLGGVGGEVVLDDDKSVLWLFDEEALLNRAWFNDDVEKGGCEAEGEGEEEEAEGGEEGGGIGGGGVEW